MVDYSKVCWSCGNETMEPYKTWHRCSNCGATWNETHPIGSSPVIQSAEDIKDQYGNVIYRHTHPRALRKPRSRKPASA